jgi:hypothetical protein
MLFTLLSLSLFVTPLQEEFLAKGNPSIAGSVQDEKGQVVPGATVVGFFWMAAPPRGIKIYL